jgi:hypothetical protein
MSRKKRRHEPEQIGPWHDCIWLQRLENENGRKTLLLLVIAVKVKSLVSLNMHPLSSHNSCHSTAWLPLVGYNIHSNKWVLKYFFLHQYRHGQSCLGINYSRITLRKLKLFHKRGVLCVNAESRATVPHQSQLSTMFAASIVVAFHNNISHPKETSLQIHNIDW